MKVSSEAELDLNPHVTAPARRDHVTTRHVISLLTLAIFYHQQVWLLTDCLPKWYESTCVWAF